MKKPRNIKVIKMSWKNFSKLETSVFKVIRSSDYKPEVILGILRGGYSFTKYLARKLNIPFYFIRIRRTSSNKVFADKKEPEVIETESNFRGKLKSKRVLIADDIATFEKTLSKVRKVVLDEGAKDIRIATLIKHTHVPAKKSLVNYYAHVCKKNDWFIFPWEKGADYK